MLRYFVEENYTTKAKYSKGEFSAIRTRETTPMTPCLLSYVPSVFRYLSIVTASPSSLSIMRRYAWLLTLSALYPIYILPLILGHCLPYSFLIWISPKALNDLGQLLGLCRFDFVKWSSVQLCCRFRLKEFVAEGVSSKLSVRSTLKVNIFSLIQIKKLSRKLDNYWNKFNFKFISGIVQQCPHGCSCRNIYNQVGTTFIQRRINVDATSWRCIDADMTLF